MLFALYPFKGLAVILNGNENQSINQTSRTRCEATADGNEGENTVFKSPADV